MQIGPTKSPKLKKQKFRKAVTLKATGRFIFVRVIDKAGNFSKWRKVRT